MTISTNVIFRLFGHEHRMKLNGDVINFTNGENFFISFDKIEVECIVKQIKAGNIYVDFTDKSIEALTNDFLKEKKKGEFKLELVTDNTKGIVDS